MRICFISHPDSTHTRRWVGWFQRHGHQVWLIADYPQCEPWSGMTIYNWTSRYNTPVLKYWLWAQQTRKLLQQIKPDILHAHRVSRAGWVAASTGFHPLVVTPWGSDLYLQPSRSVIARRLANLVLHRADLVTADSQDLCSLAVKMGANRSATHLIQWGVDTTLFNPNGNPAVGRERYRIQGSPVILSPRGMSPIYNIDILVTAFAQVRAKIPEAVLVLRDYNTNPVYKEKIITMIDRLNLSSAVVWVGLLEPWEQTVDLYRAANLVISLASSDGTPVSVLEAMACGIPVIASDLPSIREWITPENNGLLVSPRDEHSLASAIVRLLSNPALMASFSQQNLHLIKERADHETEMRKMEQLYTALLPIP